MAAIVTDASSGGDERTTAMIALCRLDRWPVPGDASDRRTRFRTEAWFEAVAALRPLLGIRSPKLDYGFVLTLRLSGFYWVWLSVAELLGPAVLRAFLDATSGSFRGTDPTRLP